LPSVLRLRLRSNQALSNGRARARSFILRFMRPLRVPSFSQKNHRGTDGIARTSLKKNILYKFSFIKA
jgi:hypothetical protein